MENINKIQMELSNISERLESIQKDVSLIIADIKPEPEFKVGQWAAYRHCNIHYPFLIDHFEGGRVYGQDFTDIYDIYVVDYQCDKRCLISVTPSEIESHLRKIAEKKGYRKGTKIKNMINNEIHTIDHRPFWYDKNIDIIFCWTPEDEWVHREVSNPRIYEKGKWAEIIPDKKPLPKTRDEFRKFIDDWAASDKSFDDFLNEYES